MILLKSLDIGKLHLPSNLLLAPMAGITNLPLRLICREHGASLCFTEMVSVNGLVRNGTKTAALMRSVAEDRPLGVQLFGDDPATVAEGARRAVNFADIIDINMGCPVRKVVGSGAGSALLQDPKKVAAIIRAVRQATELPLTVKIRSGWTNSSEVYPEIGHIAQEEGCAAVTLHPRSRADMFDGRADWDKIAKLQQMLSIPIIASGDLFRAEDVLNVLSHTGCAGAMIARGAMGNPWIFSQCRSLDAEGVYEPPDRQERLSVALRHFSLFCQDTGEQIAVREMRKHFAWYAKGLSGAAQFRDRINHALSAEEMLKLVRTFFGE